MPVHVSVHEEKGLTIVKCSDPWSLEEYLEVYPENVTPLVLFDLLDARSSHWVDIDTLKRINEQSARFDHQREGGRTAIVIPNSALELLAKLFTDLADAVFCRPITRQVFFDRDEAVEWLMSDRQTDSR